MDGLWSIHTKEHSSVKKRSELLSFPKMWTNAKCSCSVEKARMSRLHSGWLQVHTFWGRHNKGDGKLISGLQELCRVRRGFRR